MYSPSIFSRKNVQSIPLSLILIGRTAANNSSPLLNKLFALTRFGSPSPALGVTIGPLTRTSHFLISSNTSDGRLSIFATRFSIVIPSISRSSIFPASISSLTSSFTTRTACSMMIGPIPSPGRIPTMIFSFLLKSVASSACFILSIRAYSLSISSLNSSCALLIFSIIPPVKTPFPLACFSLWFYYNAEIIEK